LVEGKDKILNPELDGLQKHARKWKALISHPRILPGESYINNDSQHQRNERAYVSSSSNSIAKLVVNGRKARKRKTFVQFVAIFHLLKHGRPMTNFEHMKTMFHFLKVHHTPRKHWTNSTN
jgi:hypothetical protein